jgi:hypothetical protein
LCITFQKEDNIKEEKYLYQEGKYESRVFDIKKILISVRCFHIMSTFQLKKVQDFRNFCYDFLYISRKRARKFPLTVYQKKVIEKLKNHKDIAPGERQAGSSSPGKKVVSSPTGHTDFMWQ